MRLSQLKKGRAKSGNTVYTARGRSTVNAKGEPSATEVNHRMTIEVVEEARSLKDSLCIVQCDCGLHVYTFEVANSLKGLSRVVYSDGEMPVVRNPQKRVGMCHHILTLGRFLRNSKI